MLLGGKMYRLSDQNLIRLNSNLSPVLYTQIPTSATLEPRARKFVQEIKRDLGGAAGAMEAFREGSLPWQRCNRVSGASRLRAVSHCVYS